MKTPQAVKDKIVELLSHYEDGWDIFKKAKHWDYPVVLKKGAETVPDLPTSWLALVERVLDIIAKDKYGLDCYDNIIPVITAEEMLDNYSSVGMPVSYEHWSFGKQRLLEEDAYKKGKMGLAYEIVINTDPAIAYCMENNSPLMQILVIAHASFGHNSFFKGNHMFKDYTQAANILFDLTYLRDFVRECEKKYGFREVEKLLDACHALQSHGVHRYLKPKPISPQERAAREKQMLEDLHNTPARSDIFEKIAPKAVFQKASEGNKDVIDLGNEENLLLFIAENAPHLPEWKRRIIKMIADKAQYFYPQRQTQVMNEGWATFWHYTLLHDLNDLDLIDDGMMLEFKASHAGVLFQPDFDSPYFSGRMNPYTLGFTMFQDIKRICMEPTDEDRQWFPDIAGKGDWLSVFKDAMENFKDESFILQYLSPKVIRDFKFFAFKDDDKEATYQISAIHENRGYRHVREVLASNYRLADNEPIIEAYQYHYKKDRRLVLRHTMFKDRPLAEEDMREVLKHLYQLWEHPVLIQSLNEKGDVAKTLACPPDLAVK